MKLKLLSKSEFGDIKIDGVVTDPSVHLEIEKIFNSVKIKSLYPIIIRLVLQDGRRIKLAVMPMMKDSYNILNKNQNAEPDIKPPVEQPVVQVQKESIRSRIRKIFHL